MDNDYSKLPHLDRVTTNFLENLNATPSKPLYEMSSDEARDFLRDLQFQDYTEIPADIREIMIDTNEEGPVSVTLVRPLNYNETLPLVLYIHGGGWVMGDKVTHDMLIRKISVCTNSVVAFVNYSRSPEAVYPKAINQTYSVLKYLYRNPDEFNVDSARIAIAGDSAGGNIATAVALRALREGGPKVLCQVLLYPVCDADMDSDSYKEFKEGPWLTKKAMEYFWNAYLPDKKFKDDLYVSPLKANIQDLRNMPPALVITAENDVLRDEGEAYARKLERAGVEVISMRANLAIHDFMMLNGLKESMAVKGVFALICKVLSHKMHN